MDQRIQFLAFFSLVISEYRRRSNQHLAATELRCLLDAFVALKALAFSGLFFIIFSLRNYQQAFYISRVFHFPDIVGGISNCTNLHLGNHEGTIQSPGYPNPYPDFVQCSWFVDIPRNSSLSLRCVCYSIIHLALRQNDRKYFF
jgi:CUB domain